MKGVLATAFALLAGPALACAPGVEDPCATASGQYWIVLPKDAAEPVPAIVFLHGAGASGRSMIAGMGIAEAFTSAGWAFIAPDGLSREGRTGGGWSFLPQRPAQRDEAAFLAEVVEDAAEHFGIDPGHVALSGFSIGGSMTSNIACAHPDQFWAYAPVAGSFWRPHPDACEGPVRLLHTHGWEDTTVPLEGRPLRGEKILQGDVFHAMEIWRETNGCTQLRADRFPEDDRFWRRAWDRCSDGSALEFVLHQGGHSVPPGWSQLALDWFATLPDGPIAAATGTH